VRRVPCQAVEVVGAPSPPRSSRGLGLRAVIRTPIDRLTLIRVVTDSWVKLSEDPAEARACASETHAANAELCRLARWAAQGMGHRGSARLPVTGMEALHLLRARRRAPHQEQQHLNRLRYHHEHRNALA
jgi:hypothetical protein